MFNKSITLSNGVIVPQLALGTWLIDDDKVGAAVRSAIYANERGVGEGVRNSGVARDKIFVTTKVAAEHKDYKTAAEGIDGHSKGWDLTIST